MLVKLQLPLTFPPHHFPFARSLHCPVTFLQARFTHDAFRPTPGGKAIAGSAFHRLSSLRRARRGASTLMHGIRYPFVWINDKLSCHIKSNLFFLISHLSMISLLTTPQLGEMLSFHAPDYVIVTLSFPTPFLLISLPLKSGFIRSERTWGV